MPGAPDGVAASAGNGRRPVSWTAPADGGSPITSYTVTPYVGGVAQPATTVTGSPPATTTPITGLTNGTAYTFTVSATNAIGTGPASAASNAVTPGATPQGQWGAAADLADRRGALGADAQREAPALGRLAGPEPTVV